MLEVLRRWSTSWSAKFLFALLVLSLGTFFGMGKLFFSGTAYDVVATVGGAKVKTRTLRLKLAEYMEELREKLKRPVSVEDMKNAGLVSSLLNHLIHNALLDEEAKRLGVTISDDVLKQSLLKEAVFQDSLGHFSHKRFNAFLKARQINETAFLKEQRQLLKRRQVLRTIEKLLVAPQIMRKAVGSVPVQTRFGSTFLLSSADVTLKTPTPKMLKAFFDQHQERFKKPERRAFQVLFVSKETLATQGAGAVSDYALYERVQAIEDSLAGGLTLEQVAQKFSQPLVSVPLVERHLTQMPAGSQKKVEGKGTLAQLPKNLRKWFEDEKGFAALNNMAFDANASQEPVAQKVGAELYVFIDVKDVRPVFVPDFEAVKPEVLKVWRADALQRALEEHGQKLVVAMGNGKHAKRFRPLPPLKMNQVSKGVSPEIQTVLFQMAPQEVRVFKTIKGEVGLVRLDRLVFPSQPLSLKQETELQKNLEGMMQNDFFNAYLRSLRAHHHTQVHPEALRVALS